MMSNQGYPVRFDFLVFRDWTELDFVVAEHILRQLPTETKANFYMRLGGKTRAIYDRTLGKARSECAADAVYAKVPAPPGLLEDFMRAADPETCYFGVTRTPLRPRPQPLPKWFRVSEELQDLLSHDTASAD